MSTNSNIEWTDHTFNPWHGCTKVHAGCTNCYAEAQDKRFGDSHWGNNPRRMVLGEWGKPAKWNEAAQKAGTPARVFCASMCDLFEEYDGPVVNQQGEHLYATHNGKVSTDEHGVAVTLDYLRSRVFYIIDKTPWLEWLLLTKRPENIRYMAPTRWLREWPANVMTGTSPCNQETADKCIRDLLRVPGRHFLSCEPLLGPIALRLSAAIDARGNIYDSVNDTCIPGNEPIRRASIDWVIVGGESGHKARNCDLAWVLSIVEQTKAAGIPVFVKQLGASPVRDPSHPGDSCFVDLKDRKGGDMAEWPAALRVRQFPTLTPRSLP